MKETGRRQACQKRKVQTEAIDIKTSSWSSLSLSLQKCFKASGRKKFHCKSLESLHKRKLSWLRRNPPTPPPPEVMVATSVLNQESIPSPSWWQHHSYSMNWLIDRVLPHL
jgi:hypothetical protein